MIPRSFQEIWFLDTEFCQPDGERPTPIYLVAKEHFSGAVIRQWLWGQPAPEPPFEHRSDVLAVCYAATAEWSVYLALDWPLPSRVLDLYAEYRWLLSGFKLPGYGQLDAMAAFGIPCMDELYKEDMRTRCRQGGPFSAGEKREILAYCEDDVDGLAALFVAMEGGLQWPQALARGRYTTAIALVEADGIPIDLDHYRRLRDNRKAICRELIDEAGDRFGIYDEIRFDSKSFEDYLSRQDIAWPRTRTGQLSTREETFEEMVYVYQQLRPLYELRWALNQLKDDGGLLVGADGRNRASLRPFSTSTGRNAPSTTKFVFGKSVAFRSFIKPEPGWALIYVDWCQQEFGIAAVLSDDHNMRQAYLSGDPYLEFAKQAGAVPSSATPESHKETRELFKTCMFGVNYGIGETSLARRMQRPVAHARELLQYHRQVYRRYWRWAEQVQDQAMITGRLQTVFGWQVNASPDANWRSLRNFPSQANGAEMLRLACCLATERGVRVVAPVHDAFMIETPEQDIEEAIRRTRWAMDEASRAVLDGFTLRTDVKVVRYPERYRDRRGAKFWKLLMGILERVDAWPPEATPTLYPYPTTPTCTPTRQPHLIPPEATPTL